MPRLHSAIIKFMGTSSPCDELPPSPQKAKPSINPTAFDKRHLAHFRGALRPKAAHEGCKPRAYFLFWLLILFLPFALCLAPSASFAETASVSILWNENTESDLAGYRVYYGTFSGNYASSVDVGNTTEYTLTNLEVGVTYFIAITAYDFANNESDKSDEISYTVSPPAPGAPVAAFSGTPTSGVAPLQVTFTDQSTGNPTAWNWNFGDGSSSKEQNPVHTYTTEGNYTVTLAVTAPGGTDNETKTNYVSVNSSPPAPGAPVAAFSCTPTSGDAPLQVTCTDLSTGNPTAWSWDFGDGNSSAEQNPVHTYTAEGNYTVTMDVTAPGGTDNETKTNYLTVSSPPTDSDGDGVPDNEDAFPLDPNETTDTDGDGTGNNADEDDDDDGMPDVWETQYGLDPLVDDAEEDADDDGTSNLDEFRAGTDPTVASGNRQPDTPILLLPDDGDFAALTPVLETDAFQDPDFNDTHAQTQWQITRDNDGKDIFDLTSSTALTSLEVPKLILDKGTVYNWKVRFFDNHSEPSEWSESFAFETENPANDEDGNGIPDHQDVDAGMDMDEDGTADIDQDTIKCVTVESTNRHIGVSFKGSPTVLSIESLEYLDPDDHQIVSETTGMPGSMPYGLISFKLIVDQPGDQATVTVYLSEAAPEGALWYKYNIVDEEWQDYSAHAEFSADRRSVNLTLQDGGFGDADGIDNGIIVDPSGLGAFSSVSSLSGGGGGSGGGCFISSIAGDFSINQGFNVLQIIGSLLLAAILLLIVGACIFYSPGKSVKG